jgi:hypothetical protein
VNWSLQSAGKLLIVLCCLSPLGLRAQDIDITFKNETGSNYRISSASGSMSGHKFNTPRPYSSSPQLALSWGEKKGDAITPGDGNFLLKAGKEWKPTVKGHDPTKANLKVLYFKVSKEGKDSKEHPESVVLALRVYMGKAKLFIESCSLADNADVVDVFKTNDPEPGSLTIKAFNYSAAISGDGD